MICLAVGVLAEPEQRPHLLLGDLPPGQPEQRRAPPGPPPRRVPLGGVVRGRVPRAGARLGVAVRDVPGQVGVPVPGGDLRDGHHHARRPFCPPRGARPADRVGCDRAHGHSSATGVLSLDLQLPPPRRLTLVH